MCTAEDVCLINAPNESLYLGKAVVRIFLGTRWCFVLASSINVLSIKKVVSIVWRND